MRTLWLATLLLAACPTTLDSTSLDTTGDESGSTGPVDPTEGEAMCAEVPTSTDDCCCFFASNADSFITRTCPTVELCPAVTVSCSHTDPECPAPGSGGGAPSEFTVDTLAGLDCILAALRDGEPGAVRWQFQDAQGPGKFERSESHYVRADRDVFVTRDDFSGLSGTVYDVVQQTLKPPEYFSGCLGMTDLRQKALCLNAVTTGQFSEVCAKGGPYEER